MIPAISSALHSLPSPSFCSCPANNPLRIRGFSNIHAILQCCLLLTWLWLPRDDSASITSLNNPYYLSLPPREIIA